MTHTTEPTIDRNIDSILEELHNSWIEDDYEFDDPCGIYAKNAIKALISDQVAKDRQQLIQRIKEEVIGKKREPSNSNSSFDLYLYATNEGYNQAIDEVNQILETIMNRSSYDR